MITGAIPVRLAAFLVAAAVAGEASGQSFEHDTGQPIEITSDSLEVVQAERLATFTGNVDAVQGDVVLSADELRVFYRGSGDRADGSSGTIRRIEASGNVIVTSPRETAEGNAGTYDVAGSTITLDGGVVLTRADNVIRGDRLELDLTTGVSRVVARTTASEGGSPEERVRAVFVPDEDGEGEQSAAGDNKKAGGDGGSGRAKDPADSVAPGVPVPQKKPAADAAPDS